MAVDYIYFAIACFAGVWQAWCFEYGADNALTIILGLSMGLPFALASYSHATIVSKSTASGEGADWKRTLILWLGMPISVLIGALTILAGTVLMSALGYGRDNLPFYSLRLLIGEAVACLVWAKCLQLWLRDQWRPGSRNRLFVVFATLYAGVLFTRGFSVLLHKYSSKYFLVTSICETALSAMIVIFAKNRELMPDRVSRSLS